MSPRAATSPHPGGPRATRAVRVGALALLAVALAAGGCAAPPDDDLFGMSLEVRTAQPWGADPALRRRVHDLVEATCDHVGLDPALLWGMTLRIEDGGISCGATAEARGCTWRDAGVLAVSTLAWTTAEPPVPCVEDTPIPHELLHVRIGDPGHLDPRWSDAAYWSALSSRVNRAGCSRDPADLLW